MINKKLPYIFFKCMIRRKKEEIDLYRYLLKIRGTDAIFIIFAIASQLGGWSVVFAYVSIRDAYLPGFKILPSVQFFARM